MRHHLFDSLEAEAEANTDKDGFTIAPAKEFTEDDLVPDESVNKNDNWEFKVKSSPRKASMKDTAIDPNNPYVNRNLDADLSTVIGKHKNNRK